MNDATRTQVNDALAIAIGALQTMQVALAADASEPATTVVVTEQPKADTEFVTWIRATAEQRKARKASNAEMAAWMRSKGLVPNGAAWEACKKGERSVARLRKLA